MNASVIDYAAKLRPTFYATFNFIAALFADLTLFSLVSHVIGKAGVDASGESRNPRYPPRRSPCDGFSRTCFLPRAAIPPGSPPNVIYEHKMRILEAEARELRKKLVDKEKENESLRTEVDISRRKSSKIHASMVRSRSLESPDGQGHQIDLKRQLHMTEQEASILRQKMIALEVENDQLSKQNKLLQLRVTRKSQGSLDNLQSLDSISSSSDQKFKFK